MNKEIINLREGHEAYMKEIIGRSGHDKMI